MGFLEILTLIFVIAKVVGAVSWSWWIVFSPLLLSVTVYVIAYAVFGISVFKVFFDIFK